MIRIRKMLDEVEVKRSFDEEDEREMFFSLTVKVTKIM